MSQQQILIDVPNNQKIQNIEDYKFEPIKGYPMLHWKGKRPFNSTQYYPAQSRERHGDKVNSWINRIFWGDNLQVMSHLLKEFRGKVNLIYIDPPFDSKADYKKKISLKGKQFTNDQTAFEEKQYTDIWTKDEYLQFMYERLILIRELLADNGIICLHIDYRKSHYLRCLLDEIFGQINIINEIVWKRRTGILNQSKKLGASTDSIFVYAKNSENYSFNQEYIPYEVDNPYIKSKFVYEENGRKYRLHAITSPSYSPSLIYEYKGYKPPENGWSFSREKMEEWDKQGKLYFPRDKNQRIQRKQFLDETEGKPVQSLWDDIRPLNSQALEDTKYPTQKPIELLERIIKIFSNEDDIVFDCFMGSGTTQAVAMKLGRRFIGADINLGAVQITTKRLLAIASELNQQNQQQELEVSEEEPTTYYTGFEVYNVNHYDVFRNPVQAKELLLEALEVNPLEKGNLFDGEKDGRMIKIMPVNRIATRADLNELIAGFDYKAFEKRQAEHPNKPVEKITLICMGHEPDLKGQLEKETRPFKIDVEVVDVLRDKSNLEFKRDSDAKLTIQKQYLVIEKFYPMNLLQKLSLQQENVEDWRELVESIMIDWNYDGAVLEPKEVDIPDRNELVQGRYKIPDDAGTIAVKITDLLSESLIKEVQHG
ncbi:site-specific DNA-methyltransferase [Nostoc spongiaeforme FACHB-130]|uniref:Site-specific DNA-methyltransferase n=1 Tax=Nostoc spongiaeforme FACHB-130 TaxID=1357510 RepID=A0ABR8FXI3_9NOSO|nr:site-specific DNA-methyltransferase [Nostoc spongiaeforme]MBD2596031.1 site-specific DNA-methyltransferase [Nostoc spongiaeforme FACHB-130]